MDVAYLRKDGDMTAHNAVNRVRLLRTVEDTRRSLLPTHESDQMLR
jgi:hypothetical protein